MPLLQVNTNVVHADEASRKHASTQEPADGELRTQGMRHSADCSAEPRLGELSCGIYLVL